MSGGSRVSEYYFSVWSARPEWQHWHDHDIRTILWSVSTPRVLNSIHWCYQGKKILCFEGTSDDFYPIMCFAKICFEGKLNSYRWILKTCTCLQKAIFKTNQWWNFFRRRSRVDHISRDHWTPSWSGVRLRDRSWSVLVLIFTTREYLNIWARDGASCQRRSGDHSWRRLRDWECCTWWSFLTTNTDQERGRRSLLHQRYRKRIWLIDLKR